VCTRVGLWLPLFVVSSACGPIALEPMGDASLPVRPPVDAASILAELDRDRPDASSSANPPSLRISAPASGSAVMERVRIEGSAEDDRAVASVWVRVGPNQAVAAASSDGYRHWSLEAAAPLGMFEVSATARDDQGQVSAPARVALMRVGGPADAAPPTLSISTPGEGSTPLHLLTLVEGSSADDRGVVSMRVTRNGELLTEREIETSDFFAHWSRLVPLLPGETNTLVFTARDASGKEGSATLTLEGRASSDHAPPKLDVKSPQEGARFDGEALQVSGGASDESGIREVRLRVGHTPSGANEPVFGAYQAAETSDGYQSFSASLPAVPGELVLEVLAIDLNGLSTRVRRTVSNAFMPTFAAEVELPLRLPSEAAPTLLDFALSRSGIDEVFTEDIQREIRVLELDTSALITDAVDRIKTSCGTRWRENNENPRHDCSAAGYGSDRSPPIPWQQTPEYSMVRVLTMTPANVVVAGTSLENLQGLADLLGIGGGFHDILADSLGIAPTREIVSTPSVVRALQSNWMQTHPEVLPGAKLPISLYDSMHELMPLAERFGPRGTHPGLLDPAFPPRSALLTDSFEMRLVASSNLRWLDGVDAVSSDGTPRKDYLALVFDTTGPSFDDVLEFDFNDPARFDIRGLVAAPRADLRMLLRENPAFLRTCTANNATCRNNLPSAPAPGYVWSVPKFQIEPTVAMAAFYEYQNRRDYTRTYSLLGIPAATVTVGANNTPPGWTSFETLINLGDPPPPQYVWETISEVAQVALHNFGSTTLAEGRVNVAFTLRSVNVGLTADGIRAAMRPRLQEQRSKLSQRLLGDYKKNNGAVDFYYRRGADSAPYVFFVAPEDPLPTSGYAYTKPGFFSDAALTNKVSTKDAGSSGDSTHEKLAIKSGESVVYMSDAEGQVLRLRFVVGAEPREIAVFLARKVR
jgi:Bacterial Ig domain